MGMAIEGVVSKGLGEGAFFMSMPHYKKEIKERRKPLIFHLVPHILYKGTIDIENAEVIRV